MKTHWEYRAMRKEAERRIAKCKANHDNLLVLEDLGLQSLPDAVRELTWLAVLE